MPASLVMSKCVTCTVLKNTKTFYINRTTGILPFDIITIPPVFSLQ